MLVPTGACKFCKQCDKAKLAEGEYCCTLPNYPQYDKYCICLDFVRTDESSRAINRTLRQFNKALSQHL